MQLPCLLKAGRYESELACLKGCLFTIHEEERESEVPIPSGLSRQLAAEHLLTDEVFRIEVTKLMTSCNRLQQKQCIAWASPLLARLALRRKGAGIAMSILDQATGEDRQAVVASLGPATPVLCRSRSGHQVLVRFMERFPASSLSLVALGLQAAQPAQLARTALGCYVLEQAYAFLSDSQLADVTDALIEDAAALAQHPRGNVVLQAVLDRVMGRQRTAVLSKLHPKLPGLALQRWGAHVCARVVALWPDASEVEVLIEGLPEACRCKWTAPLIEALADCDATRESSRRILQQAAQELARTRLGRHCLELFGMAARRDCVMLAQ